WQSSTQSFAAFREANVEMTKLLLEQVDAKLNLKTFLAERKVVVIPDGVLFYVPFEALLIDTVHRDVVGNKASFDALRPFYLIAHADVSYAPSASAWMHLAAHAPSSGQVSILGVYGINYEVGDPHRPGWAIPVLGELRNLPETEQIGRILDAFHNEWAEQ